VAEAEARFRVTITNLKAVRALGFAAQVLLDAQESAPWNADLTRAARALRYAARRLRLEQERNDAKD
jgi:hypothetical protein